MFYKVCVAFSETVIGEKIKKNIQSLSLLEQGTWVIGKILKITDFSRINVKWAIHAKISY